MKRYYTVYHDGGTDVVESDAEERRAQERTTYQEQRTVIGNELRQKIEYLEVLQKHRGQDEERKIQLRLWRDALQVVTGTRE